MKKMIFAMAVMAAAAAMAASSFSYQGALKTADGTASVTGTKKISFRLYDQPTDGKAIWGRMVNVQLNGQGLFNVELSDVSGSGLADVKTNNLDWVLANYLGFNKQLFIGLEVENSVGEIRPRQKLLSVPAAAFAQDVATAKNDFTVEGTLVAAKGITGNGHGKLNVLNGLSVSEGLSVSGGMTVPSGAFTISGGSLNVATDVAIKQGSTSVGFVPQGVIVMWSGSASKIPAGWALCNGQTVNGVKTPDLTGRFIVGASAVASGASEDKGVYPVNTIGGTNAVALTKEQMPNHYHLFPNDDSLYKRDVFGKYNDGEYFSNNAKNDFDFSSDGSNDDYVYKTGTAGGDATSTSKGTDGYAKPHQNLPPYYALCFIMKL